MKKGRNEVKSRNKALNIAAYGGLLGLDRFYLGYKKVGILKLCTLGCMGILWFMDIINIESGYLQPADGSLYLEDRPKSSKKPKGK